MNDDKLYELLEKVSPMSFEEGKKFIESQFEIVNANEIFDGGRYDFDYSFDDNFELVISFTSSYTRGEEEDIVNYDEGYWHISGEQYKAI